VKALKKSKEDFEKALTSGPVRLVWIYGNAGCGKSTYVHRVAQTFKDKISVDFCDFEQVTKACTLKYRTKRGTKSFSIRDDQLWQESNLFRFKVL
jgi:RNA helicase